MKHINFFHRAASTLLTASLAASQGGLSGSSIYTGTVSLINDLMSWLMVLCPLIGGLAAVYCMIRRSMADQQEGKMWTNRIVIAIACGVGGSLVTGLIAVITSYYVAA